MKPVYVGSVRGYQPPVYRPGLGWSSSGADRRAGRGPAVFAHRRISGMRRSWSPQACPGFKTKVAIVAVLITVAALLWIVYGGAVHL